MMSHKRLEPVTEVTHPSGKGKTGSQRESPDRFYLWIDGVGGFLVCLGNQVTLGQADPDARIEVPIFADISPRHAIVQRDPEGYLLEALRKTQVNGKDVDKVFLRNGDRITLGSSCQLQFWQSTPVSASARLELVSGHRLLRPVNAVLLMAEALVFGPGSQTHVTIAELPHPLMIFRQKDGLAVRYAGKLAIEDREHKERGPLEPGKKVVVEDMAVVLERVSSEG